LPVTSSAQTNLFAPEAAAARRVGNVIVREVECRSLLNRWDIDDYSFNCYTGCEHGCGYCYARYMQRFHPHEESWGDFVDAKINAPAVLARQLRRLAPGTVFTCSACDGWQPVERHYQLTRQCCRLLLDAGFKLRVLTKSQLVLRDLDLFRGRDVHLGVTITTPDQRLADLWEPQASTIEARLGVLRQAREAGLRTTLMLGPLLPFLSDTDEALDALFALARRARVDRIWHDALNPRPRVWPAVQGLLRRHWPGLVGDYQRVLFEPRARKKYIDALNQRVRQAARRAGIEDHLA